MLKIATIESKMTIADNIVDSNYQANASLCGGKSAIDKL
jgi:hypothetical protein